MHIDTNLLKYEFSLTLGQGGGRNGIKTQKETFWGGSFKCSFDIQMWL